MRTIQLLVLLVLCAVPGAMACDGCSEHYVRSYWANLAPLAVIIIALFAMTLSGLDVWESLREFLVSVPARWQASSPPRADSDAALGRIFRQS